MWKKIFAAVVTCLAVIALFYTINWTQQRNKKDTITVGFLCMGDESVPYSANFLDVQEDIHRIYGEQVTVIKRCNVSPVSSSKAMNELIDANCNLIIADSSVFAETSKQFAKEYPDIEFCQATGVAANEDPVLKNYHNFMGCIYEGRYVAGVVAGLKMKELIDTNVITETQAKIGYVAAYPYPEVISGYTAFFLGARSIVPKATMEVGYVDSWNNFYKEEQLAGRMIEDQCVIISQHSDTNGPAIACEKAIDTHTVYHVGYNTSMTEIAPTTSLISTKINWSPYIVSAIQAVMNGKSIESQVEGTTKGQDSWSGFDKNWVQMLDLNNTIAAEGTQDIMNQTIEDIKDKKIAVFQGDYMGKDPENPDDVIDLRDGYQENKESSAPTFHYILDDVITIKE